MKVTVATSKFLNLSGRATFKAKWQGLCRNCGLVILAGDDVFYLPGQDRLIGDECCGNLTDDDLTPDTALEDGLPAMEQTIPRELVMPRGRTVADRCGKCFMVPASNGACDCG
jgi:hypothetical protein